MLLSNLRGFSAAAEGAGKTPPIVSEDWPPSVEATSDAASAPASTPVAEPEQVAISPPPVIYATAEPSSEATVAVSPPPVIYATAQPETAVAQPEPATVTPESATVSAGPGGAGGTVDSSVVPHPQSSPSRTGRPWLKWALIGLAAGVVVIPRLMAGKKSVDGSLAGLRRTRRKAFKGRRL